jgi:prevent-host-death family protein
MVDLRQVFSLTDFLRHHKEHVARLECNRKPVVLTVKGRPVLVLQDAKSYQDLLDRLEVAENHNHS